MKKAAVILLALIAVLALAAFAAPTMQASTAASPSEQAATPTQSDTQVETCTICHKRDGATHQQYYDELYQDGVIKVENIKYAFKANPDTTTITFNMTMNGQPFDPAQADALAIYWVPFKDGKFQWEPARDRLSLKGKITSDGKGLVTSTLTELAKDDKAFVDYADIGQTAGVLAVYGRDGTTGRIPGTRVDQNKYPFAGVLVTGSGVDYESTANDAGCVKCHTDPYLKHGYIYAQVNNDPKTDFMTCKVCHIDNAAGGHYEWQLLVDNPQKAAEFLAEPDEEKAVELLTEEELALYAYNPSVMNDVHMSHAMEFPYPQSMANCVTCHEGKIDRIVADENFTVAQCKSCHPVTGAKAEAKEGEDAAWDTTGMALKTLIGEKHPPIDWANPGDCTLCHKTGGVGPAFNQIHTGYDRVVYNDAGIKYSDAVSVTITSAAFKDNKLTFAFKAAAESSFKDIDVSKSITPTVMVSLYGWDTKDFLFGAHERSFDDNKDGKVDSSDGRNIEAVFGAKTANPRLTITSKGAGQWEAVADLTSWAAQLGDGSVKRAEVGVLPAAYNADGLQVAVDAATRTVDLGKGAFDDKAFAPITQVEKCENCHAALATNFHNPSYGGSVTACRMCHITKAGGSHLELQSRSIDSYAHAIHSMQYFDIGNVVFDDEVQALEYEHHTAMPYPTHGITNCESCHVAGTYNPPTQDKSLPGLLSPSANNETMDRAIEGVPAYVVGPAERACGGCHRAQEINADKAGNLRMLNQHFEMGGYLIPAGDKPVDTLMDVINKVMALFGK
jgi:OmcA/MtrC family decaheme c-type cytochrome